MLSLIYSFPPILHFQLAEACSTLIPNSLADFPAGSCIVVDASEVTSWVAPTALRQHCVRITPCDALKPLCGRRFGALMLQTTVVALRFIMLLARALRK